MEVIRECDIFNDDSAEVIEVEEKAERRITVKLSKIRFYCMKAIQMA